VRKTLSRSTVSMRSTGTRIAVWLKSRFPRDRAMSLDRAKLKGWGVAAWALVLCGGCVLRTESSGSSGSPPKVKIEAAAPASRSVVENYLKAASAADGATMYGLIATSERKRESPESLHDTAKDRYSPSTTWEVLKTDESGTTSQVTVEFKGADVDPNPTRFTLSKESGEWRIVDSPELHEREKDGRIRIKL
jgi:hypothetical protein